MAMRVNYVNAVFCAGAGGGGEDVHENANYVCRLTSMAMQVMHVVLFTLLPCRGGAGWGGGDDVHDSHHNF